MEIPSLLRIEEHRTLSKIPLQGSVIDLGGDTRSAYRTLFPGVTMWYTVNMDPRAHPDLVHDLENQLPIKNETYDNALLVNVLEHVYNHKELLREAARVVKKGGKIVVVVPFLFPIHPSPQDFWRFTDTTLERLLLEAGCDSVMVTPLGSGLFATRFLFLDRLLPTPIRVLAQTLIFLVRILDSLFDRLAHFLGKKYRMSDYALGFIAVGSKL